MPKIDITGGPSNNGRSNDLDSQLRALLKSPSAAKEAEFLRHYGDRVPHSKLFNTGVHLSGERELQQLMRTFIRRATANTGAGYSRSFANSIGAFKRVGGYVPPELYSALGVLQRRGGVISNTGGGSGGVGSVTRDLHEIVRLQKMSADALQRAAAALSPGGSVGGPGTIHVGPGGAAGRGGMPAIYRGGGGLPMVMSSSRAWRFVGGPPGGGGGGGGPIDAEFTNANFPQLPPPGRRYRPLPSAGSGMRGGGGGGGGSGSGFYTMPGGSGLPALYQHPGMVTAANVGPRAGAGGGFNPLRALGYIGAAVGAVRLAVDSPMLESQGFNLLSGATNSRPYMDLKSSAYNLARAGGNNPIASLANVMGPPGGGQFKELGMGPQDVMRALSSYGVVPGSAEGFANIPLALRRGSLSPGFAGMNPDILTRLANQSTSLGITTNTGAGVQQTTANFSGILTQAVRQGVDRSRLVDSMQSSLESMAKSGGPINMGAVSDIYSRLQGSNFPGARTGASAAGIVGGLSNFTGQFGKGAIETTGMTMAIRENGGLGSMGKVQQFLGLSDSEFKDLYSDPIGKRDIDNIISLSGSGGANPLVGASINELGKNNPQFGGKIVNSIAKRLGNGYQPYEDLIRANLLGGDIGPGAAALGLNGRPTSQPGIPETKAGSMQTDVFTQNWREMTLAMEGSATSFGVLTTGANNAADALGKFGDVASKVVDLLTGRLPSGGGSGAMPPPMRLPGATP